MTDDPDVLAAVAANLRAMADDFAAGRTWPDHRPPAALIDRLIGAATALDVLDPHHE